MADLFGKSMKKEEIREHVGDLSQICNVRRMVYTEGIASGIQALEVTTGSGLNFTVLPSRGLDISHASFNGSPLAWISAQGETSPFLYQPEGLEWLRSFFGGLLTTCGMTYASHPCEDEGEQLGLHGRVSNYPAENVNVTKEWDGDDYYITISGNVRETKVFGDNLILKRTIRTSLGACKLSINDTIENNGFKDSPLMMLYHINIGWPVVSESSRLITPSGDVFPFDDNARSEPDSWSKFISPQPNYQERVYLHEMTPDSEGRICCALINEEREIGVYLNYPKREFPHFIEWKMMGQGEYVVGIEPGNITGHRAKMRSDGTLEFIKPSAKRSFSLEIGVLNGKNEIAECVRKIESVHT